jgi:hypothetical protein
MRLAGERVFCRASLAALLVGADVDRVVVPQRVEPLILTAATQRGAAEMAIDLDSQPLSMTSYKAQSITALPRCLAGRIGAFTVLSTCRNRGRQSATRSWRSAGAIPDCGIGVCFACLNGGALQSVSRSRRIRPDPSKRLSRALLTMEHGSNGRQPAQVD